MKNPGGRCILLSLNGSPGSAAVGLHGADQKSCRLTPCRSLRMAVPWTSTLAQSPALFSYVSMTLFPQRLPALCIQSKRWQLANFV